jgi:hypothetical protein
MRSVPCALVNCRELWYRLSTFNFCVHPPFTPSFCSFAMKHLARYIHVATPLGSPYYPFPGPSLWVSIHRLVYSVRRYTVFAYKNPSLLQINGAFPHLKRLVCIKNLADLLGSLCSALAPLLCPHRLLFARVAPSCEHARSSCCRHVQLIRPWLRGSS